MLSKISQTQTNTLRSPLYVKSNKVEVLEPLSTMVVSRAGVGVRNGGILVKGYKPSVIR